VKTAYDPQHDRAVLALSQTEAADAHRQAVNPWLTLVLNGDRLVALEVTEPLRHLSPDVLLGDDLVGVKEAADLFGVKRSNFVRDIAARADFPTPVADLASTRVWRRRDLLEFRSGHVASTDAGEGGSAPRSMRRIREGVTGALAGRSVSDDGRRWLPEMTARLVRRFAPERIILFGSQASGQARADSDVDLLVVLAHLDGRKLDAKIAMRQALRGIPVGKDIMVATPEEIERQGQVAGLPLHSAMTDGIVLYDRAAAQ
jgi:uncharacterized protein